MRFFIVSVACLVFYAVAASAGQSTAIVTDAALAKIAEDSVLDQLDNPKTAEFRFVAVHTWLHKHSIYIPVDAQKYGYRAVCGSVRYKDSKGAMTPYIRFIYISQDSTIGISSEDWADNCVE